MPRFGCGATSDRKKPFIRYHFNASRLGGAWRLIRRNHAAGNFLLSCIQRFHKKGLHCLVQLLNPLMGKLLTIDSAWILLPDKRNISLPRTVGQRGIAVSVRQALQKFRERISAQTILTPDEAEAILSLNGSDQRIREGVEFVERERVVHSVCIVVEGLVARTSVTVEGRRQISAFYIPGDIPDLFSLMQPRAASSLRAMTQSEIVRISHDDMRDAINAHPGLMEAFWRYAVWDASAAVEWVTSLGQRKAPERVAHLFCEMAVKNGLAGAGRVSYRFPITQSILAEALGLSAVHVNRSLQRLRNLNLLHVDHAAVVIPDWNELTKWAGFDAGYLQPDQPLRMAKLFLPLHSRGNDQPAPGSAFGAF